MIFSYERFHYADTADVFLDNVVHEVELFKHTHEDRMRITEHDDQAKQEHRRDPQKDQGDFRVDVEACAHREDQHDRSSYRDTDHHLVCVLYICNIGGQSCNDTACLKLVDV